MTFAREFKDAFSDLEPIERRRLGRLGAVLFMAGSLTAIPTGLLLEPPPKLIDHVVSAIGFSLGLALIWLPWERVSPAWLHFFPLAGTIIVIAGVAVFSVVFSFFLVLAAMFVAISVRNPRVFSAYMAFFAFALLLPLTYKMRRSLRDWRYRLSRRFRCCWPSASSPGTCTRWSSSRRTATGHSRARRSSWASGFAEPRALRRRLDGRTRAPAE